MPPRRTPLLGRVGLDRRGQLARGSHLERRTPLNPVSQVRAAAKDERSEVRALVFARDGRCLLDDVRSAGGCWGPLTPHHLRKEGQGGAYDLDNLVTLCAGHNRWVEMFRSIARQLGLEVSPKWSIDHAEAARRRQANGLTPTPRRTRCE